MLDRLFRRELSPEQRELATLRSGFEGTIGGLLGENNSRTFQITGRPLDADFPSGWV